MVSLIEKSPGEGLLPRATPGAELREVKVAPIHSIAPFNGCEAKVTAALKPLGVGFPGPGQSTSKGEVCCLWTGRGQAFLLGAAPPALGGLAAVSDQSDGWAVMALEGVQAEAVLARLVPLDLRAAGFGRGAVARSLLGHMPLIVMRTAVRSFQLMVFRSMAASAVHELDTAMRAVAARG